MKRRSPNYRATFLLSVTNFCMQNVAEPVAALRLNGDRSFLTLCWTSSKRLRVENVQSGLHFAKRRARARGRSNRRTRTTGTSRSYGFDSASRGCSCWLQTAALRLSGRSRSQRSLTEAAGLIRIDFEADVAQLVEQSIRNRQVIGSSPIVGSIFILPFPPHNYTERKCAIFRYNLVGYNPITGAARMVAGRKQCPAKPRLGRWMRRAARTPQAKAPILVLWFNPESVAGQQLSPCARQWALPII